MNNNTKEGSLRLRGLLGIMLASSLTIMVGSAVTPALPQLSQVYHIPLKLSNLLVTMPALGVFIAAFFAGKIIDKKGPYFVCKWGLLFYGVLGIAGFLMPKAPLLLLDRLLLGFATACVMTSSTGLLSAFYSGKKRLRIIAIQGMAIELGGIIFLSIGGFLAELAWQGPFFIYAIALVAWLMVVVFVPGTIPVLNEEDAEEEHSGKKHVWPVIAITFFAMLVFFSGIVNLPIRLQGSLHLSQSFTGNFLAFISFIAVITAGIMPKIVKAITAKYTLMLAFVSFAVAFFLYHTQDTMPLLILAAIFMGIGFGCTIPLLNNLTVDRSPMSVRGRNLGFYSMATFAGQFSTSFLASSIDISIIFGVVACIAIAVAALILLFFRN